MRPNLQKTADLVTYTEEILNYYFSERKLYLIFINHLIIYILNNTLILKQYQRCLLIMLTTKVFPNIRKKRHVRVAKFLLTASLCNCLTYQITEQNQILLKKHLLSLKASLLLHLTVAF